MKIGGICKHVGGKMAAMGTIGGNSAENEPKIAKIPPKINRRSVLPGRPQMYCGGLFNPLVPMVQKIKIRKISFSDFLVA